MTTKVLNIYQRINEVMKKVDYVQKDSTVKTSQTSGYRAVSHDNVTALVRQHLVENGIVLTVSQTMQQFDDREIVDGRAIKGRMYTGIYEVRFTNIDDKNDFITVNVGAQALDNGDKAPGKAMSYATKYAILKTFMIETGEQEESRAFDPSNEAITAEELTTLQGLIKKANREESNIIDYLNKQGANIEKLTQLNESWFQYSVATLKQIIKQETKNAA